jgi:hypothetical protein
MAKIDVEGVRWPWIRNTTAEANLWLAHIDRRTNEVQDAYSHQRMPLFEIGDLLFNTFSYPTGSHTSTSVKSTMFGKAITPKGRT